jgi:hypothetical protein
MIEYIFTDNSDSEIPYKQLVIPFYGAFFGELSIRKYPKKYFLVYFSQIEVPSFEEPILFEPDGVIFDKVPHKELKLSHIKNFVTESGAEIDVISLYNLIKDMDKMVDFGNHDPYCNDGYFPYDNGGHPDNFGDR